MQRLNDSTKPSLHSRPPLERMLRIHQALQAGGFPNASKLAREIEVSTKTIHRDIEFMRDRLNLPIEFAPANNGYFYNGEVSALSDDADHRGRNLRARRRGKGLAAISRHELRETAA